MYIFIYIEKYFVKSIQTLVSENFLHEPFSDKNGGIFFFRIFRFPEKLYTQVFQKKAIFFPRCKD